MTDNVNHPKHYTALGAECECGQPIEVIKITERMDFVLGNAVKYILRAPFKGNELEDLKKAQWYVNRAVETRERFEIKTEDDPDEEAVAALEEANEWLEKAREDLARPYHLAAMDEVVRNMAAATATPHLYVTDEWQFFAGNHLSKPYISEETKSILDQAMKSGRTSEMKRAEKIVREFADAWRQVEKDNDALAKRAGELSKGLGEAWQELFTRAVIDWPEDEPVTVKWRDPAARTAEKKDSP